MKLPFVVTVISGIAVKLNKTFRYMGELDSITDVREWFMNMYMRVMDSMNARKAAIVERLEEYVNENYRDPNFSVDILVDKVQLSTNYVRLIYKEKTNRSLSNYIGEVRLEKAKEVLRTTKTPITAIIEKTGFQNSGYFYKFFKKNTDMTPDQYMKESKNESS